jgi:hypothetical protein
MDNQQILNEFFLLFKGQRQGSKIHLTDTIRRIVKDRNYDTEDASYFIINSGYFKLEMHDAVSLTDKGFEQSNLL